MYMALVRAVSTTTRLESLLYILYNGIKTPILISIISLVCFSQRLLGKPYILALLLPKRRTAVLQKIARLPRSRE